MECGNHENEEPASAQKRILIAEDNPSNYKLVEVLLRRNTHYDLIHAWDGFEAVELFGQKGADLVLMDISMPVMDGYEALKLIRASNPSIPVVALTAFAFEADRQRMLEAGFNACMSKPLNAAELQRVVASYLS